MPRRGVLIVMLARRYGGADARVLQLAAALHGERPYAVAVLAGSPIHERLAAAALNVVALPFGRGDPRLVPRLLREARRRRLAVIDAQNPQSHLWGALAGRLGGLPLRLCTVHSVVRTSERSRLRVLLYEATLRLARRLGCRFVAVSPAIAGYLGALGIPPDRIEMIANGVDSPPADLPADSPADPPADPPAAGLRAALGWSDAYLVAAIGRLEPVKGLDVLLDALAALAAARPGLRCLVVGDGRERAALESRAAALGLAGRVHFAGFRRDVPALLAECDLLCLPSRSEGLPYVVLEAMAAGRPVLATRVGSLPEILSSEIAARMVPPGDAAALAASLGWFIDHPEAAAALGRAGRALVGERFGSAAMIARTLAAYDRD